MKLMSYLTLTVLLSLGACSHHHKKDCCKGKEQATCSKEKCDKPCCDKEKKCKDGSCDKKSEEAKSCCKGDSCQKKSK